MFSDVPSKVLGWGHRLRAVSLWLENPWGRMRHTWAVGCECASVICEAANHLHYSQLRASALTPLACHTRIHTCFAFFIAFFPTDYRALIPQAAGSVGRSRLHISCLHAHNPPLMCVAFFPTDYRAKYRPLTVYWQHQDQHCLAALVESSYRSL